MDDSHVQFFSTEWSLIMDKTSIPKLYEMVSSRYWQPIYAYLRQHKGIKSDESKDIAQEFFLEIILGRDLVQKADREKGKFRSLLLAALNNFVASYYRKQKRRVGIEAAMPEGQDLVHTGGDVLSCYDYEWALNLMEQVLDTLETECCRDGLGVHWKVFQAKILTPILEDVDSPSLKEICIRYGVDNASKASNMIVTINRRFERILERFIRQTVDSDEEVADEIAFFIKILTEGSAGYK